MSPSATPVTQSAAASRATNGDHKRATRPSPAPQAPHLPRKTKVGCAQAPRLPRETKVDVAKGHACHAKCRGVTQARHQPSATSGTRATQNEGGCEMCHACHVKRRWMSPSGKPATESRATNSDQARHQTHPSARSATSAASATPATPNSGRCRQAPRLPCETKMNVFKRHACHAKRRWM